MTSGQTIAILGAGSWGTAVAVHLGKQGSNVILWSINETQVSLMEKTHMNETFLPGIPLPDTIKFSNDLNASVANADHSIIAVPSHAFASVLEKIHCPITELSWLTKGLHPGTNQLLSQEVNDKLGTSVKVAVIAGPSFAKEVALGLPTALTIACHDQALQTRLISLFHHDYLRIYASNDLIGVQICGAIKNVIAIACGVSDGIGYGANAKAALITRGLAEMHRLGLKLGAKDETFFGLAGTGDLVLTCTDDQSRNRRFGLKLGQGMDTISAEKSIRQVVEGKHNAKQVFELAQTHQVEMPICEQVYLLIHGKTSVKRAINVLFNRPPKNESEI